MPKILPNRSHDHGRQLAAEILQGRDAPDSERRGRPALGDLAPQSGVESAAELRFGPGGLFVLTVPRDKHLDPWLVNPVNSLEEIAAGSQLRYPRVDDQHFRPDGWPVAEQLLGPLIENPDVGTEAEAAHQVGDMIRDRPTGPRAVGIPVPRRSAIVIDASTS